MGDKKEAAFAALFFPKRGRNTYVMYVSDPPPLWLGNGDMSKMVIEKAGVYCLFFLIKSKKGGRACITVNGREVRGSFSSEKDNEISGSAVCSIRDAALPCTLGITTEGGAGAGLFVVADCEV